MIQRNQRQRVSFALLFFFRPSNKMKRCDILFYKAILQKCYDEVRRKNRSPRFLLREFQNALRNVSRMPTEAREKMGLADPDAFESTVAIARQLYRFPYLLYHNCDVLDKRRYAREFDRLIREELVILEEKRAAQSDAELEREREREREREGECELECEREPEPEPEPVEDGVNDANMDFVDEDDDDDDDIMELDIDEERTGRSQATDDAEKSLCSEIDRMALAVAVTEIDGGEDMAREVVNEVNDVNKVNEVNEVNEVNDVTEITECYRGEDEDNDDNDGDDNDDNDEEDEESSNKVDWEYDAESKHHDCDDEDDDVQTFPGIEIDIRSHASAVGENAVASEDESEENNIKTVLVNQK